MQLKDSLFQFDQSKTAREMVRVGIDKCTEPGHRGKTEG